VLLLLLLLPPLLELLQDDSLLFSGHALHRLPHWDQVRQAAWWGWRAHPATAAAEAGAAATTVEVAHLALKAFGHS
jgi:hypothetical protein